MGSIALQRHLSVTGTTGPSLKEHLGGTSQDPLCKAEQKEHRIRDEDQSLVGHFPAVQL